MGRKHHRAFSCVLCTTPWVEIIPKSQRNCYLQPRVADCLHWSADGAIVRISIVRIDSKMRLNVVVAFVFVIGLDHSATSLPRDDSTFKLHLFRCCPSIVTNRKTSDTETNPLLHG